MELLISKPFVIPPRSEDVEIISLHGSLARDLDVVGTYAYLEQSIDLY